MELLIKGVYSANIKLGTGSFGKVYQGINENTGEKIAIKLERKDTKFKQLLKESIFYRAL
jgi:serine/threonine protein kinase